jgi:hypothetical protein
VQRFLEVNTKAEIGTAGETGARTRMVVMFGPVEKVVYVVDVAGLNIAA